MNPKNLSFGTNKTLESFNDLYTLGVLDTEGKPVLYATMLTVDAILWRLQNVCHNSEFSIFPYDTVDFNTCDTLTLIRKSFTAQVVSVKLNGVTHKLAYTTVLNYHKPVEGTPH
jgi:hypothetical protein